MTWFSAEKFNNAEMISTLIPLTSEEGREAMRSLHYGIVPTEEQAEEYSRLRYLLDRWLRGGQINHEIFREVAEKVIDYRCNYDWRDRITKNENGRMGVENALGEMILPNWYELIPERYTSITCPLKYYPVGRRGKFALTSTEWSEIPISATPYEYEDLFILPFSDGQFYAVREGEKWRLLRPVRHGLEAMCGFILDAIYPLISDKYGEIRIWPVKAGNKWGLIYLGELVAPEYDDFLVDYKTMDVQLINNGEIVKVLEHDPLPF